MHDYIKTKRKLLDIIDGIELSSDFVQNPGKDFSRNRKLNFRDTIRCLLLLGQKSFHQELMDFFSFSADTPSASAFQQQRKKLKPALLETIFHDFTHSSALSQTYKGYRILAVDGSDVSLPYNPCCKETYVNNGDVRLGFNRLHLNALYDLGTKQYIDAVFQGDCDTNECGAMVEMIGRSPLTAPIILTADRAYESWNLYAHLIEKDWNFVIRAKDIKGHGIAMGLELPEEETFDLRKELVLTRSRKKSLKEIPDYKHIHESSRFDYVNGRKDTYPMSLRIVRFALGDSYEILITNLPENVMGVEELKKIYGLRWGVETSFRKLKHNLELEKLHSRKLEYIHQEIYARLIMYNFCEQLVSRTKIPVKDRRYDYQLNFSETVTLCREFIRGSVLTEKRLKELLLKNMQPVRKGRKSPRNIRAASKANAKNRLL